MIPLILTLILLCFLQEAFLPFNLVLLIIIARSFVIDEKENFYLAFIFGLLLSFLAGYVLGVLSIIYLIIVLAIHIFRRIQFVTHPLIVIPVAALSLLVDALIRSLLLSSSANLLSLLPQILLIVPIYFMVLFWEERFIPRKDIKLKMGK